LMLLCHLAPAQHCNSSTLEHQRSQNDSQSPQQALMLLPQAPQAPHAHPLLLLLLLLRVLVKALAGCCQLAASARPHRETQPLPLGCHPQASLLLWHWRCCHRSDSSQSCCLLPLLTHCQQNQLLQQPLLTTGCSQRCCWAAAAANVQGLAAPGRRHRRCCHCCNTELAVRSGTFRA
jgi:hypothetical protein